MKQKEELAALTRAVEKLHGAKAVFAGSEPVHEQFQGRTVWEGVVSLFDLKGHPTASRCYAWSVPADGTAREKFYAVLETIEVDSPSKAVRASIVADNISK
jgi:hypothetical protein